MLLFCAGDDYLTIRNQYKSIEQVLRMLVKKSFAFTFEGTITGTDVSTDVDKSVFR